MRRISIVVACVVVALCGCDREPRITSSTDGEKVRASVTKVKESLPEDQRDEFMSALMAIVLDEVGLGIGLSETELMDRASDRIAGLTAEEVFAESDRIRAEQLGGEARKLVSALESAMTSTEPPLKITVAQLTWPEDGFLGPNATITLMVRNTGNVAVARAYFECALATPGRAIPWVDARFNYRIPGGLESGESALWRLDPNTLMDEWAGARTPIDDAIFVVRCIAIDGPNGAIAERGSFGIQQAQRLEELIEEGVVDNAGVVARLLEEWDRKERHWWRDQIAASALAELDHLRTERDRAERERGRLNSIVVTRAWIDWGSSALSSQVLRAEVRNESGRDVNSIDVGARVFTRLRETPWFDEDVTLFRNTDGPVRPGATGEFRKHLDYGALSNVPKGEQATTTVQLVVRQARDVEHEEIFELEFDDERQARLDWLERMAAEQGWRSN